MLSVSYGEFCRSVTYGHIDCNMNNNNLYRVLRSPREAEAEEQEPFHSEKDFMRILLCGSGRLATQTVLQRKVLILSVSEWKDSCSSASVPRGERSTLLRMIVIQTCLNRKVRRNIPFFTVLYGSWSICNTVKIICNTDNCYPYFSQFVRMLRSH